MNGYFSVFDPTGKKIADCGALRDAVTLIGFRNAKWEGHYYQFTPVYQTIDINSKKYFPSDDIVVNMDGGVGGSWSVKSGSIQIQPGVGGAVEFTTQYTDFIKMKKQEMIDTLTKQGQDIKKELVEMQQTFTVKKEMLNRIEGALEALSALEPDGPPAPVEPEEVVDHTAAAAALGILK